jgi:hypothetical protein
MSFQEAGNLLKEIGQRQALSYIGLAKPEIDVSLELGLQGSDWYRSRTRQDVSINLEAYKARPTNPREYTEALDMLHDFIGRGRLISVFDIARLNKIISDNSGVPLHRVLEFKGLTHKRSFGNIGKSPIKKETIDEHLHRIAKEYREGCK